jgi:hypothetical protein
MSTEIKTIKGTCHYYPRKGSYDIERKDAELYLTRFYNGKDIGTNIQLTVSQNGGECGTSYIHLNKNQCEELAKTLLECFDYEKYPSE